MTAPKTIRRLNPREAPKGYRAARAIYYMDCRGCQLPKCGDVIIDCRDRFRKDGHSVIFKKVKRSLHKRIKKARKACPK
jgi:hypothetical protein